MPISEPKTIHFLITSDAMTTPPVPATPPAVSLEKLGIALFLWRLAGAHPLRGIQRGRHHPIGRQPLVRTRPQPSRVRWLGHRARPSDGKLLFGTHPMQLTEARIEALLSGDEGVRKIVAELTASDTARHKASTLAAAKAFGARLDTPNGRNSPVDHVVRAALAWKTGDKDQALTSAKRAAALPTAPFERFVTAVAAGTPPSLNEFQGWLKEERAKVSTPPAK